MRTRVAIVALLILAAFFTSYCSNVPKEMQAASASAAWRSEQVAAGLGPDVTYVNPLAFEDINSGLIKSIPEEAEKGLGLDDFYPQVRDFYRREGALYAVPHDVQPVALLVNREFFAKHNLPLPTDWDDLVVLGLKLQQAEQATGNEDFRALGLTTGFWNWLPFLFQAGGSLWNSDGDALALNTPQALQALSFYQELVTRHKIACVVGGDWPGGGFYGDAGVQGLFVRRKIGMFLGGPGMYAMLRDAGLPVEAIVLPKGPAGMATVAVVRGFGITAAPARQEMALSLVRYATSQEGMRFWIGDAKAPPDSIPARMSLQAEWLTAHPDTKAFVQSIAYVRPFLPSRARISVASAEKFDQLAGQMMEKVLSGTPASDALETLQREGMVLLEEGQ